MIPLTGFSCSKFSENMAEDIINGGFYNVERNDPEKIKAALTHVWTFLKEFISLANTHGADFLSHQHWEAFIPSSSVRRRLLSLNGEELANLPLRKLKEDNIGHGCPGRLMHEPVQLHDGEDGIDSLKNLPPTVDALKDDTMLAKSSIDSNEGIPSLHTVCDDELNSTVVKAFECHLQNLAVLTSYGEAMGQYSQPKNVISEAMSEKKSHEVQLMSNAVAAVVRACKADLVVDVGSGKGYLSMELADHHRIGVIGLDSCDTNTHGAKVRKEKLVPRWSGLVAREEREVKKNRETRSQEYSTIQGGDDLSLKVNSRSQCADSIMSDSKTLDASSLYVPLTMFVDPSMDLRHVVSEHAAHLSCGSKTTEEVRLVLTGLHTCGSLAVSAMRLFMKDKGAVGLCCVGCCYQLMEEANQDERGDCEKDFPVSQFGKSLGLHLGRNARNLASQSVHRLQTSKQLQGKDFYWRALLEVLLRNLSLPVPERIMGMRKLNKQCKTFYEYAVKAFGKLGFTSDMFTQEMITSMEEEYQQEQMKMAAFFQYKLLLAPVIESLILLDRLLFLAEQDCVGQAFLVQLFDSVTSPRCYALVAYKADAWKVATVTHSGPS